MRFFKRQAPKNMKKEDLIAKCWIIADQQCDLLRELWRRSTESRLLKLIFSRPSFYPAALL
ncbi:MAG: hypothetical protein DMG79_03400 [Acidobacteria bacterium]|nr:MAG: hypothetical protein DMG79_03400 [Acidobacteriota bacterium]